MLHTLLLVPLVSCLSDSSGCCGQTLLSQAMPSVPSVLPETLTDAAPPGRTLLPRATVPTVLAWAPVRGDPVLSPAHPCLVQMPSL